MEEASNTRIVAFQLMQVAHLQAIQIMARFCQGDILAMKRIQYGAHKCVAKMCEGSLWRYFRLPPSCSGTGWVDRHSLYAAPPPCAHPPASSHPPHTPSV